MTQMPFFVLPGNFGAQPGVPENMGGWSSCVLLFLAVPLVAQDAAGIMARVAANQDRSQAERTHYVYVQHARVLSRKGKTVRCEEVTETRVTPTPDGSNRQLLKLDGRLLVKHAYVSYEHLPSQHVEEIDNDEFMDRDLVENMRENLTQEKSKDGLNSKLFPLTSKTQGDYDFKLLGSEKMNGRDVFHVTFKPKDKEDFGWKGDAYIDRTAYQPVLVQTTMARRIPFAVRTLLGTSLPNLGFTVTYEPQAGGVWFPVSFGTEFKLHVLFFLNREILISAQNRSFEQTHVTSTILPAPGDR